MYVIVNPSFLSKVFLPLFTTELLGSNFSLHANNEFTLIYKVPRAFRVFTQNLKTIITHSFQEKGVKGYRGDIPF